MPESRRKLAERFQVHQPRDVALAVAIGVLTGALGTFFVLAAACWSLASRQPEPELTLDHGESADVLQQQLPVAGATSGAAAMSIQLASKEHQREESSVVQTTGHVEYPAADPSEIETAAYPTTDAEPTEALPPPEAVPPAPPMRRPLPGPVNMVTGHDPSGAVYSTGSGVPSAADRPREKVLSRISRAWRKNFSRPATGAPADIGSPDAPVAVESLPPREPVSAAASDAWYNRRWR